MKKVVFIVFRVAPYFMGLVAMLFGVLGRHDMGAYYFAFACFLLLLRIGSDNE